MSTWIRKVGNVTFTRITSGGKAPRVMVSAKGVEVTILVDKRTFDAATFAAFCTKENAKRMVKEYVDPLLKWVAAQ